jgi:hypothetical protein
MRGRLAWLEDKDLDLALMFMPRRCVAERSILDFWKRSKGTSDYLGALGTVSLPFPINNSVKEEDVVKEGREREREGQKLIFRSPETSERCMYTPINHTSGT